jgi:hypothetical protein
MIGVMNEHRGESTPQTMPDALRSDHRAISTMLADPATSAESRDGHAAREQLVMMMVRHFVAEEQYLYPTVRQYLPHGGDIAEAAFAKDRGCEHELKGLEAPDLTPAGLAAILADLTVSFRAHVDGQEAVFEALATTCEEAELVKLGEEVRGAEQLAPTRPRSVAPSSPTVNKLASLVEGFIDQVRDSYTRRGVDRP